MATEPKRKDPTEAALSAIEEALSLDATPGRQARRKEEGEPRLPDVAESRPLSEAPRRPLEGEGIVLPAAEPAAEPAAPPPPRAAEIVSPDRAAVANDDRESVGSILQALQRRPSRRPYVLATLASALWLGAVAGFVTTQIEGGFHAFIPALSPVQLLVAAVALFAPLVLFYVAAMLAVRSMEMKQVARAVGEMAVRLVQP